LLVNLDEESSISPQIASLVAILRLELRVLRKIPIACLRSRLCENSTQGII